MTEILDTVKLQCLHFIFALQSLSFFRHVMHQKRTINAETEQTLLVQIGLLLSVLQLKANNPNTSGVIFLCVLRINYVLLYYNPKGVIVSQHNLIANVIRSIQCDI